MSQQVSGAFKEPCLEAVSFEQRYLPACLVHGRGRAADGHARERRRTRAYLLPSEGVRTQNVLWNVSSTPRPETGDGVFLSKFLLATKYLNCPFLPVFWLLKFWHGSTQEALGFPHSRLPHMCSTQTSHSYETTVSSRTTIGP